MFYIFGWVLYGLIIGLIAKAIYTDQEEPQGCLITVSLGIAGSFAGGLLNYLIGFGGSAFSSSGIIMSIVGSLILLYVYSKYKANNGQ